MKSSWSRFAISSRTIRQSVAAIGVIISLAFVGMQIRESNIQARAAAYQAIGISTAEFHRGFDARMNRLVTESVYPEAVKRWTLEDWERIERIFTADLRLLETVLLQVEQGVLPADATARLGYNWGPVLSNPAMACLWPELRTRLHPASATSSNTPHPRANAWLARSTFRPSEMRPYLAKRRRSESTRSEPA